MRDKGPYLLPVLPDPPQFQTIPTLSSPAKIGCDPFELRDKNKAFLPEIRLVRYSMVGMQM